MVKTVVERAGAIDILINNAAIFDMAPLLEITEESYDKVFAINVKGLLFTLQAVAQHIWLNKATAVKSSIWPHKLVVAVNP